MSERYETYLRKAAGEDVDISNMPEPSNRYEYYLKQIAEGSNVDPEVIAEAVSDWLDAHPEATTTVEDGSITKAKLDEDLQETVDDVDDLKSAITQLEGFTDNLIDGYSSNLALLGTIEETKYYKGSDGTATTNNSFFSVVGIPMASVFKNYPSNDHMYGYTDFVPTDVAANAPRSITFWDSNGNYISGRELSSNVNYAKTGVTIPQNAVTMRATFYYKENTGYVKPNVYWLSPNKGINEYDYYNASYRVLTSSIKDIDEENHADFISPRRPTICFVLDGNYERTQDIIDIAEAHGYRIGLAPKWDSSFDTFDGGQPNCYFTIADFLKWQDDGHEILAHLGYNMPENTSYTDAQCITFIKGSYQYLTGMGFRLKGAVGSSGKVADRFIPYVNRWYSYGSTEANHSEQLGTRGDLLFATSDPSKLWRYSMQTSTLDGMKQAVDDAITNNGLVIFYGHALSSAQVVTEGRIFEDGDTYGDDPSTAGSTTNLSGTDHFTEGNFAALLDYIDSKVVEGACRVKTPYYAINDYYKLRKTDLSIS